MQPTYQSFSQKVGHCLIGVQLSSPKQKIRKDSPFSNSLLLLPPHDPLSVWDSPVPDLFPRALRNPTFSVVSQSTLGGIVPPSDAFCVSHSEFTKGFWCSIASVWLMRRQLGPPQKRSVLPSPMIMGEWNCGCGSLCSSRQLGCLLFILGRLCSSPSLPRHDLTFSQIVPGRQNGVSDQCCLHFTDGKTEAPREERSKQRGRGRGE